VLKTNPALKDLLFDFSEPYKIDLEAFMMRHYMYNVSVSDFARLSGRSRAGFKRDFEKIFRTSPGQWLQQKRLNEAYYLIKEKGIKPSSVYLDVGFENLSHFSFAFKKAFGVAPSLLSGSQ
jgi:AraC-like DNA-binding protein